MTSRLLTKQETAKRLHVHAESLMRLVRAGRFPKPIRLTPTPTARAYFLEHEVEEFLAARAAERD